MNNFEKQLDKATRGTKMTAAEKRELRARVVSYMEYHPRRETVAVQKAQAYIESQPYTTLSFHNRYLQAIIGACAVFAFVVVPTIAERAVPGDVLYPIKVRVNEEVRSTLTFSATEKIEWETERLNRRISEVRLLAEEGKLTAETEAEAAEAVKAHATAAQDEINKLKESDADAATLAEVEFESALEVQSAVLDAKGKQSSSSAAATDELSIVVKEAQATVGATKGVAIPAFDRITARLELQTTRAYELFMSLEEVASEEERAEIERRLNDIERKVDRGVSLYDTEGVVPDALLEALADIQKLISFMTDIDVRASVALEELVPVELTDEEKLALVAEHEAAGRQALEHVAEAEAAAEIDEVHMEKILIGAELLEQFITDLGVARENADIETQIDLGDEIFRMARDIETLLKPVVEEPVERLPEEGGTSTDPVDVDEEQKSTTTETDLGTDEESENASSTEPGAATSTDESTQVSDSEVGTEVGDETTETTGGTSTVNGDTNPNPSL